MCKNISLFFFVCVLASVMHVPCFAGVSSNAKNFGFMKDSRDGQIYKTVKIGMQTWMAENLNYETPKATKSFERMMNATMETVWYDDPTSFCYNDDVINCTRFGRLYAWKIAMQACPEGWRLPTKADWEFLISFVGREKSGKSLKSSAGWFNGKNGTDTYGFTALPAGMKNIYSVYGEDEYSVEGRGSYFWSSTELDSNGAYGMYLQYYKNKADLVVDYKNLGGSVRCVMKGEGIVGSDSSRVSSWILSPGSEAGAEGINGYADSISSRMTGRIASVVVSDSSSSVTPATVPGPDSILTDSRDGQTYRTVTIGPQTWMAENLNYKTPKSYCYEDKISNCAKYGRLYAWSNVSYPAQGVCPDGWHLPTDYEWKVLLKHVDKRSPSASKSLKSRMGWFGGGDGTDDFGFSARPAGFRYGNGRYSIDGRYALFWSHNPYLLKYNNDEWNFIRKSDGLSVSVRCIKDVSKETMTDSRDGHTYKIVKIGNQTWMAENLNYKTEHSSCASDADSGCVKFGRKYTWASAMGIPETFNGNDEKCNSCEKIPVMYPVQGVCPVGWHLPTKKEWDTLIDVVGGSGGALKSRSGWKTECERSYFDDEPCSVAGNGSDYFGFEALAINGYDTGFWTSVGNYEKTAYRLLLSYRDNNADMDVHGKKFVKHSVRCVKDSASSVSLDSVPGQNSNRVSSVDSLSSWTLDGGIGSITDSRDGQTYKIVKIGSQTWMAQNLNYKTDYSFCYDDDSSNCVKYGRLYAWSKAIRACPAGWHLPDSTEWNTLFAFVGGRFEPYGKKINVGALKSTTDWNNGQNGSDEYGFSVFPSGEAFYSGTVGYGMDYIGKYKNKGSNAHFWSASENKDYNAYYIKFDGGNDALNVSSSKAYVYSVRCLKDDERRETWFGKLTNQDARRNIGSIKDPRDGHKYKTVKIGKQTWMAENLNYKTEKSSCYDNVARNCTKFGRFYNWIDATNACPAGWHLPDTTEWNTLFTTVGGRATASKVLKSKSSWKTCENWSWENGNGTDDYGFSALPAGFNGDKNFNDVNEYASFWSSSANNDNWPGNTAYYMYMVAKYNYAVYQANHEITMKRSVRCVKDE